MSCSIYLPSQINSSPLDHHGIWNLYCPFFPPKWIIKKSFSRMFMLCFFFFSSYNESDDCSYGHCAKYLLLGFTQEKRSDRKKMMTGCSFLVNYPFKIRLMCSLCTSWLQHSASVVNMIKDFKQKKVKKIKKIRKSYVFFLFCFFYFLLWGSASTAKLMMENTWSYRAHSLHSR